MEDEELIFVFRSVLDEIMSLSSGGRSQLWTVNLKQHEEPFAFSAFFSNLTNENKTNVTSDNHLLLYIKLFFFPIITELINKANCRNRNTEDNRKWKLITLFHTMCWKKRLIRRARFSNSDWIKQRKLKSLLWQKKKASLKITLDARNS